MKIEVRTITPEVAAIMLENNPENRDVKKFHMWEMAEDMLAGRWKLDGTAIRFNCNGSLIDGQHRLLACVKAGVPFETLVISGLPNDVRDTIDGGSKRTHADRLKMAGFKNTTHLASAARFLVRIAENTAACRHSIQMVQGVIDRHPGITESITMTAGIKMGRLSSVLAAVHYIGGYTGNAQRADDFVRVFLTGVPTYPEDAAHALRERVIRNGKAALFPDMAPAVVQTWRNFSARKPIRVVREASDIRIAGWGPDDI